MARRLILILIALFVSAGAILLAQQWLRGSGSHQAAHSGGEPQTPPPVQVLVAKTNLFAGDFIRADSLVWQTWAPGPVPDAYLVQTKTRMSDLVGAVVRSRIAAGEPVTLTQVVRTGDRGFMAAVLTPGRRAITVNVSPSSGVAGFVFPGDRVDLILTLAVQPVAANGGSNGGPSRHVSETLLRDVRIVGMDQSFTDGRKDEKADLSVPHTATLEVTPKQAEIVAVAGDVGVMSFSLRSLATPGDAAPGGKITKTWDTEATQIALASGPKKEAETPQTARAWTVDVVRGGAASQVAVPDPTLSGRTARP
jgi:pilus assembly protein CpaB